MNEKYVAKRFDERAHLYEEEVIDRFKETYYRPIEKIVELASPKKTEVVLDIGAGTGAVSLFIAPYVKKIIAIDISEKMLQEAKNKVKASGVSNIEFRIGSFLKPNLYEKVDIIVSNLALHHLPDEDKKSAIKVMHTLLNEGGKVVFGDVMFFFDPEKEPEKIDELIQLAVANITDESKDDAIKQIRDTIETEYPSKAEDLKQFFEEYGFEIVKLEEMFPLIGIVFARKKG